MRTFVSVFHLMVIISSTAHAADFFGELARPADDELINKLRFEPASIYETIIHIIVTTEMIRYR